MIAVGATRYDETLAYYSNFGLSIDLVAPGGDLTVDQNGDGYGDGVLQNTFNPNTQRPSTFGYWFFQGTSMASPHAAGTAQGWGLINAASALAWTQGPGPTPTNTPVPPPTATNTPVPDTPADIGSVTLKYEAKKDRLKGKITELEFKPVRVEVTSSGGGSASVERPEIESKGND